jgi:hypothetical protein
LFSQQRLPQLHNYTHNRRKGRPTESIYIHKGIFGILKIQFVSSKLTTAVINHFEATRLLIGNQIKDESKHHRQDIKNESKTCEETKDGSSKGPMYVGCNPIRHFISLIVTHVISAVSAILSQQTQRREA